MKAIPEWKPSKFIVTGGHLCPTDDPDELAVGSRVVAQCMGYQYQKALNTYARGRLLDLGCGKVPLYAAYRDLVDEVVCVDWNQSLHDGKHVDLFCDLNEDLNLERQSFDTVILSDVLEHIRKPEHLLARVHELLRDDGSVVVGVPFFYCLHEEPHDFFRYTRFALRSIAEESGYEVCYLEEVGGAFDILADIIGKLSAPLPLFQRTFVKSALMLRRLRLTQKLTDRTKQRFPLGYLMVAKRRLTDSTRSPN
jgi:SAM-dependent methyltransferase